MGFIVSQYSFITSGPLPSYVILNEVGKKDRGKWMVVGAGCYLYWVETPSSGDIQRNLFHSPQNIKWVAQKLSSPGV